MERNRWRETLVLVLAWPAFGLSLMAAKFVSGDEGSTLTWPEQVWGIVTWLQWSLLTPLIVRVARRTPPSRLHALIVHVCGGIAAGLVHLLIYVTLQILFEDGVTFLALALLRLPRHLTFGLLNYSAIVFAVRAIDAYRIARDAEVTRADLERRVAEAEFERLRLELQPDALFRALRRIQQRLARHPAQAETLTLRLSRLLRRNLDRWTNDLDESKDVKSDFVFDPQRQIINEYLGGLLLFPLFGTYTMLLYAAAYIADGYPVGATSVAIHLAGWSVAGLLATAIVAVTRRNPLTAATWRRSAAWLLTIAVAHALATQILLPAGLLQRTGDRPGHLELERIVYEGLTLKLILSFVLIGVLQTHGYAERARETRVRAARLATQLTRAKLAALRAQLRPHFLFNALNSIVTLISRDAHAASRMIDQLLHLLRLSLSSQSQQIVTLRDEREVVESYLAIEKTRFRERLSVTIDIPSDLESACVPNFILQPLVENAVRHGISRRSSGGSVRVSARRHEQRLHVTIEDDGQGFNGTATEGIGNRSVRSTLRKLYGDGHELRFDSSGAGTTVGITIPLVFAHVESCA